VYILFCPFFLTLVKRLPMIMVIYFQKSQINLPPKGTSLLKITFPFKCNGSKFPKGSPVEILLILQGPILMPSSTWKPSWVINESFLQRTSTVSSLTICTVCRLYSCYGDFMGFLSLPLNYQHSKASLPDAWLCIPSPSNLVPNNSAPVQWTLGNWVILLILGNEGRSSIWSNTVPG